jgi:FtsP/CotA-like multicopper oxidase with cupredoxin domain
VEGDRIRIFVTNKLPEHTSIHWHGIFLPNGMDGVGGLTQPHIKPGETYVYEFTLRQHGTFMYHPHADEMVQLAVGMMGFFIIHPKAAESPQIDRDFAIMSLRSTVRCFPPSIIWWSKPVIGCASGLPISAWMSTRFISTGIHFA